MMSVGSDALETLSLDDTTSVRLVLSSIRYNSPSGEHGVPFYDYAGECIVSLELISECHSHFPLSFRD